MDNYIKPSQWSLHFEYDGVNLIWKKSGKIAGWVGGGGYVYVTMRSKKYRAHRIIWEMHHGKIPENMQVDHINHDRADNRIKNLRLVSAKENQRNMSLSVASSSGVCGVCFDSSRSKYRAHIRVDRKKIHLGYYNDFFDAVCARKSANNKYRFHDNHGDKRIIKCLE